MQDWNEFDLTIQQAEDDIDTTWRKIIPIPDCTFIYGTPLKYLSRESLIKYIEVLVKGEYNNDISG